MPFRKNKDATIWALINFSNKVIVITLVCASKLGFKTQKIDVEVQQIDKSSIATYRILIIGFQVVNKFGKVRFF